MTLDSFIGHLQLLRARYGGEVEVWVKDGIGQAMIREDVLPQEEGVPPERIVWIE